MQVLLRRCLVAAVSFGFASNINTIPLTETIRDVQSRSNKTLMKFQEWLIKQGSEISKINIKANDNDANNFGIYLKNRSFFNWANFRNKIVASFPCHMSLTYKSIASDPLLGDRMKQYVEIGKLPQSSILALYLMIQRALKEQSKYNEYIQMLPKTINTPLFYSANQLQELRGTPLYKAVDTLKKKLKEDWNLVMRQILPDLFKQLGIQEMPNFEDYLWAHAMIWSRSMELPLPSETQSTQLALVPGFDFLNYSLQPNCQWKITNRDSKCFIHLERSSRRWYGNNELTIGYGDKSNEQLLFTYGFVLDMNPFEELHMFISLPEEEEHRKSMLTLLVFLDLSPLIILSLKQLEDSLKLIQKNDIDSALKLFSQELWTILGVLALPLEDIRSALAALVMDKSYKATMWKPPTTEESLRRLKLLQALLEENLIELEGPNGTGTLEKDISLLEKLAKDNKELLWLSNCCVYRSFQKKLTRDWLKLLIYVISHLNHD